MAASKGSISTIRSLISVTGKLRRDLEALIKEFPEDHLPLGDRIFVRLMNPIWRNLKGVPYGADEKKKREAVKWIDRLYNYSRDLADCTVHVMGRRDVFDSLPLNCLQRYSAEEYIRRLGLQEAALKRIYAEQAGSEARPDQTRLGALVRDLKLIVDKKGLKYCENASGVHRDTISDLLEGRVVRPQTKTKEKLETFANATLKARHRVS